MSTSSPILARISALHALPFGALLGVGSLLMLGSNAHFLQQAQLAGAGLAQVLLWALALLGLNVALLALVTPRKGGRWVLAGLLLAGAFTGSITTPNWLM
jgi:hypothetical protein